MKTLIFEVTQTVEVTVDEAKFTPEFMAEFRAHFFDFDTVADHAGHIAQLQARGVIELDISRDEFIEGYGPASGMGIAAKVTETTVDEAAPW